MQLFADPTLPATALRYAQLLSAVSGPNPKDTLDPMIQADTLQLVRSWYYDASALVPKFFFATSGDLTIVMIAGCSLITHASAVIEGYSGGLTDSLTNPANQLWGYVADYVTTQMGIQIGAPTSQMILIGHSMGGCAADAMFLARVGAGQGADTKLCTFGAPKLGSPAGVSGLLNQGTARWFCSDDPVPLIPPTTDDTIAVALVFSARELIRFSNFVHPAGGIQLSPNGTITSAVLPADASINTVASLVGWLLAVDGSSSSGHHISSYAARLALWIQNNPTNNNPPVHTATAQRVQGDNRRIVNQAEERAFRQLSALQEQQNAQPVLIPPAQLFTVEKLGRTYIIRFGDTTVAMSASKKGAHQLSRTWNAALKSLQHQPVVETTDLIEQLQAYTDVAADPNSGIRPTLNTHIPG